MSPEVCKKHIALYVNDYSLDLGQKGRDAIGEMLRDKMNQNELFL